MRIEFHKDFTKQYKKLPLKLQMQTKDRLKLFTHDPDNISLRRHRLKGDYSDYWSISISGDYRALYQDCGSYFLFIKVGSQANCTVSGDSVTLTNKSIITIVRNGL